MSMSRKKDFKGSVKKRSHTQSAINSKIDFYRRRIFDVANKENSLSTNGEIKCFTIVVNINS